MKNCVDLMLIAGIPTPSAILEVDFVNIMTAFLTLIVRIDGEYPNVIRSLWEHAQFNWFPALMTPLKNAGHLLCNE